MLQSFYLAAGLVLAAPFLVVWNGPLVWSLVVAYVAIGVVAVALALRPGEASYLATVMRPFGVATALPAVWMLIQAVPMPISGLLHPVWISAREALDDPSLGFISVDPGATLVALSHYLAALGILLLSAVVTVARERAERGLTLLAAVTSFVAAARIVQEIAGVGFLDDPAADASLNAAAVAISALGIIIAAAASIRAVERFETRRSAAAMSVAKFGQTLVLCLLPLAICACAIGFYAARGVVFAVACAIATMVWGVVVRRIGLGPWFRAITAAMAIGGAAVIVLSQWSAEKASVSLRFAASPSATVLSLAQRLVSDASWTGGGAGTFAALVPIYRAGDDAIGSVAPTMAANIAVELGWPALWAIMLIMVYLFALLVHGTLRRGRDSFYVTAAAGAAILLSLESFCDASLANPGVIVIAATLLGLGIAQSASRAT